jgi:deoxyribonuclease (pyrimidine dimer)
MVRINLINPKYLTDQHLIAEYNEILMLFGYVRKHPKTHFNDIPKSYRLGQGHILFFKNKLKYLKERFQLIKKEMKNRGFKRRRTLNLSKFDKKLKNNWRPKKQDKEIIKRRIIEKIKIKPGYYSYYRNKKPEKFLLNLIKNAT